MPSEIAVLLLVIIGMPFFWGVWVVFMQFRFDRQIRRSIQASAQAIEESEAGDDPAENRPFYNIISADEFIATLRDPRARFERKRKAVETLCYGHGLIRADQQAVLRGLLRDEVLRLTEADMQKKPLVAYHFLLLCAQKKLDEVELAE